MKALSISQPWVWAILHPADGMKRIENRDWQPPKWVIGQTIAIHASKTWEGSLAVDWINRAIQLNLKELGYFELENVDCPSCRDHHFAGAIVATAKIEGVYDERTEMEMPESQRVWFTGKYGWLLSDVQPLEKPVPCKGALRFWEVPADVLAEMGAV